MKSILIGSAYCVFFIGGFTDHIIAGGLTGTAMIVIIELAFRRRK
jgi:hypothetical protein